MRQNYLREGGHNTGILAQMADMEAEAQRTEDKQRNKHKRRKGNF